MYHEAYLDFGVATDPDDDHPFREVENGRNSFGGCPTGSTIELRLMPEGEYYGIGTLAAQHLDITCQ